MIKSVSFSGSNQPIPRNKGTPLHTDWFDHVQVNFSASERRATTLTKRRSVKKEYQAA